MITEPARFAKIPVDLDERDLA